MQANFSFDKKSARMLEVIAKANERSKSATLRWLVKREFELLTTARKSPSTPDSGVAQLKERVNAPESITT